MIGHLRPSTCSLDQQTRATYQNFYCSICASLRGQYSLPYTLFINNELTLVLLAFEENMAVETGKTRCPSAGFTLKRPISKNHAVDLAAKLSLLLGWVKVVDWNADKPALYKKAIQQTLQHKVNQILPSIGLRFQQILQEYLLLTQENSHDFEYVNQQTGLLSKQIAIEIGLKTNTSQDKVVLVSELFRLCGQLISITDHLVDLEKDQLANQYNPILEDSKTNLIPISTAYSKQLLQFNRLIIQLQELSSIYRKQDYIAPAFHSSLLQAISRMKTEVKQKRPSFIDQHIVANEVVMAAAGCGPELINECDCAQTSNYFDQQVSRCCCEGCKGCKCPCENCGGGGCQCCKGGGCGDCNCSCDICSNCGKGSGDCCSGCGHCCNDTGKGSSCCDGGCCCDGSSGGGSGNNYEDFQRLEEQMQVTDSLNQLKGVPMDEQLKASLKAVESLNSTQLKELNQLVDSVAQQDPDRLESIKKLVDTIRLTETSQSTSDFFLGDKGFDIIKETLQGKSN
ncbi:MAG: DUF5685 family protein [Flammeovirgaceae bacterium]